MTLRVFNGQDFNRLPNFGFDSSEEEKWEDPLRSFHHSRRWKITSEREAILVARLDLEISNFRTNN